MAGRASRAKASDVIRALKGRGGLTPLTPPPPCPPPPVAIKMPSPKVAPKATQKAPPPKKNGKADKDFYLRPSWYDDLKAFVDAGVSVLLIGPAGSGKSRGVKEVFKERQQFLRVVSCTPRLNANDLEGDFDLLVENGKQVTKFSPAGPALASQHGDGLLFDEVDAAPAEAMYSVYRLLDGEEMHIVRKGQDALVQRHPELRIVGTQNTEGRGDDRGLYHGRSHQDEAFLDRWENTIRVSYPTPDDEAVILCGRTGIGEVQAKRIVAAANAFRAALANGDEIMFTCSLRRTLAVAANLARGHTPRRAWEFAVLNRATPEDAARMPETLNRIYGTKW